MVYAQKSKTFHILLKVIWNPNKTETCSRQYTRHEKQLKCLTAQTHKSSWIWQKLYTWEQWLTIAMLRHILVLKVICKYWIYK
jgi:hypothetical protein